MRLMLILVFLVSLLGDTQGQDRWPALVFADAKFSILAPDSLDYKATTVNVPIGLITYHTYYYQNEDDADNIFYQVMYFDYPDQIITSDSTEIVEAIFEENINSALNSVNGELSYEHDIEQKDFPGKLFKIVYNDNTASIKTKMYIMNDRYYSISVAGFREKSLNPNVERFLDSFTYIPPKEEK